MAFAGDLSKLALGDILQTLAMTRQAGILAVRGREERRIAFSDRGIAVLSQRASLGLWLGRYLVGTSKITQEQLDGALKKQRREPTRFLADFLSESGAVSEEDLEAAKRYLAQEEVFDLFLWKEGEFAFEPGETDEDGPFAHMWFGVGGIAMEAARRMDEGKMLMDVVPPDEVFVKAEGPDQQLDPEQFSENVRRIFELLDGSRTVEALRTESYLGSFDTLKAVATLVRGDLVRVAGVEELVEAAEKALAAKKYERAAGLFEVAAEKDPTADALRERASAALARAGEKRAAATQLVIHGEARLEAGDGAAAEKAFRKAVRLDHANPSGHVGVMRALFAKGDTSGAIAAARAAGSAHLALDQHEDARMVSAEGLEHDPGDVPLRLCLANALLGLDARDSALEQLDELAGILESTGENDRRLTDVYRQIVQLDPERKDCAKRLDEIQEFAQARRKKVAQRSAVAVGVLLLGLLAVPLITGPGIDTRIDTLDVKITEGQLAEAGDLVTGLGAEILSDEQRVRLDELRTRLRAKTSPEVDLRPVHAFGRQMDALYREADELARADRPGESLARLLEATSQFESTGLRKAGGQVGDIFRGYKKELADEVHSTLSAVARSVAVTAQQVAAQADRFTPEVLRKADVEQMGILVTVAEEVRGVREGQNWAGIVQAATDLVKSTGARKDKPHKRIQETVARLLEDTDVVAQEGPRALAAVRKARLEAEFYRARREGKDLVALGELEDAVKLYRGFLDLCDEMRDFEPVEIYAPIAVQYFQTLGVDGRIRDKLDVLETVFEAERRGDVALDDGDFAAAWDIRVALVRAHPGIPFGERFRLPVRVVTRPPGAEVFRMTDAGEPELLGSTPLTISCDPAGPTEVLVRRTGFSERTVTRSGQDDARGGIEILDLLKESLLSSNPDQTHTTEAGACGSPTTIYVAGRNGIVRAISRETGQETARFATGRLDGIAEAPALVGGRLHVATLDGIGFVLDGKTLAPLHTYPLDGPSYSAVEQTARGGIVTDSGGVVRLVSPDARELWKRTVGKVKANGQIRTGTLYLTTVSGELVGLSTQDGSETIRVRLSRNPLWGPAAVHGKRAYVGCDDHTLVAVDLSSRKVVWRKRLDGPIRGRPAVGDGFVVAATTTGAVHVLSAADGETRSRMLLGAPVRADLLTLGDGFVVVTEGGIVSRFDGRAELIWRFDTADTVTAPARLVGDEIVVVSRRGAVFVLSP